MNIRVFLISAAATLFIGFSNTLIYAQTNGSESDFLNLSSVKISTDIVNQNSGAAFVDYLSDEQNDIFYQNPFFGIEMEYAAGDNTSLVAELSYTGSHTRREYGLMFVLPPPPESVTHFRTSYNFYNVTLAPKAKINFELHNIGFFWSAGPIFSGAFLKTDIDGATYGNRNKFSDYKKYQSISFGFGAQTATGLQYFVSRNIGLSVEIGYKYLRHGSLHTIQQYEDAAQPLNYRLNTLFQRFGIILKL